MRMGAQMTESTAPLVCNVSGPGALVVVTHVRNTIYCEQQLDVESAILSTLAPGERGAEGKVIVLGAGDLRFLRTLGGAEPLDGQFGSLVPSVSTASISTGTTLTRI